MEDEVDRAGHAIVSAMVSIIHGGGLVPEETATLHDTVAALAYRCYGFLLQIEHLVQRSEAETLSLHFLLIDFETFTEVVLEWHFCGFIEAQLFPELLKVHTFTFKAGRMEVGNASVDALVAALKYEALAGLLSIVSVPLVAHPRHFRAIEPIVDAEPAPMRSH